MTRIVDPAGRAGEDKIEERKKQLEEFQAALKRLQEAKDGKYVKKDLIIVAKVAQHMDKVSGKSGLYSELRKQEKNLMGKVLNSLKSNDDVGNAFKRSILEGIHVESILGLKQHEGLGEFRTNYGVPPDGAELSEKSLMNLFGEEAQGYLDEDQISEQRKLTKAGEHDEAAKVKEQLMNELDETDFRIDNEKLYKFSGKFFSPELETSYHFNMKKDTLTCQIRYLDPVSLKPTGPFTFKKDKWITLEFENNYNGFTLNTGRAKNIKFKRIKN